MQSLMLLNCTDLYEKRTFTNRMNVGILETVFHNLPYVI